MQKQPSISIITPSLNRAKFIEEAIKSVLIQDYPNVEHLIMDGGSTDGTLDVLARYQQLRVISKPDEGLYYAINKGLKIAKGEIIGVLNTDDYYEPRIFESVVKEFTKNPRIDAVSGGSVVFKIDSQGNKKHLIEHQCIFPYNLMERATIEESSFNAWFFRKRLFNNLGFLSTRYRLLADRDFLIRFAIQKHLFSSIDIVVYYYRQHPDALTFNERNQMEDTLGLEAREIAENYLNHKELHEDERRVLRAWLTHITIKQANSALRRKSIKSSIHYANIGLYYNPLWMIEFLRQIPRREFVNLIKKFVKKNQ